MRCTEREFVERLRRQARRHLPGSTGASRLQRGIGDDCAVISFSRRCDLLVTTDLFLEEIHFRRAWQEPVSVGYKALARGLSDIAAMGGSPRHAFLSLALPRSTPERWVTEFLDGFFRLAKVHGAALAGGDTAASRKGVAADVVVIGEVPRGQALLRSGARPHDELWVTGWLGGAAHGLAALRGGHHLLHRERLLQPLFYPQPRIQIGSLLRQRGLASAMIDLSDGLSIDLARLCQQSGVGARLDEEAIPCAEGATRRQALHGGEDLELLFTAPPRRSLRLPGAIGGVPLTRIGEITSGRKLRLVRAGREIPLPVRGFQHF